jgi:hypothetical protein
MALLGGQILSLGGGGNCPPRYIVKKGTELSVVKQVSEGELHANKDDALKSSGPCSCSCKCSGGVAVASLEGLKLDIEQS